MELKSGYKQTEIGVIPTDWDSIAISCLATVKTGSKNTQDRVVDGAYPFFVRSQEVEQINSYSFDGEAVLTAGDGVGTGKVFHYVNGKFDIHQRVYRMSNFDSRIDGYFFYLMFSSRFYERVMSMTAKSSVDSVRRDMIVEMQIPVPASVDEQKAIAAALSDVDSLIDSLEVLVAKKRSIKTGVMQELLTGRTRLPGFTGDWEYRQVGSLLSRPITDGPHLTPSFTSDGVPFLSVNNIVNNKIDWTDLRHISTKDDRLFSLKCKPQRGDILFGKAASVGKIAIVETDRDFNVWSPLAVIRFASQFVPKFVFYSLQTRLVSDQITLLTNSSSQGNIGMRDIGKLKICLPQPKEQVAISAVLSDIDDEVETLEKRIAKTRDLKQGMAQELLTGRTRLV